MIYTIERYLDETCGISQEKDPTVMQQVDRVLHKAGLSKFDMAFTKDEYLCDCIYYATRHKSQFKDIIGKNDFAAMPSSERQFIFTELAARIAGKFVATVSELWADHGHTTEKCNPDNAKNLIAGYLIDSLLPCEKPWELVAICQTDMTLRGAYQNAYVSVRYMPMDERIKWLDNLKNHSENLIGPNAVKPALKSQSMRDFYFSALKATLGI